MEYLVFVVEIFGLNLWTSPICIGMQDSRLGKFVPFMDQIYDITQGLEANFAQIKKFYTVYGNWATFSDIWLLALKIIKHF